ncbi:MAG: alanyl-tRNA editing protein, partial [Mesorhizobium sp.]
MHKTEALFRDDAYLKEAEAAVVAINDRGGVVLDRTIFYATSGGQPGDTGLLERADGSRVAIAATITGETKDEIIHVPAPGQAVPTIGERLKLAIDWQRRHLLMRMHAACHLLTVVCPFPITGAAVSVDDSRVDFDIPDAGFTKEDVTARLMELVRADHPIFTRLITDQELAANPGLVKSKNVRPPVGTGKIRL